MYITSLASNETFKFSLKINKIYFYLFFLLSSIIILIIFDFKNLILNNKIINNENSSFIRFNFSLEKNIFLLNKIYNFPINLITILLVNYLFLTLIATVKITNIFQGPIRPKIF